MDGEKEVHVYAREQGTVQVVIGTRFRDLCSCDAYCVRQLLKCKRYTMDVLY